MYNYWQSSVFVGPSTRWLGHAMPVGFKGTKNMLAKIKPLLQDAPNFDVPTITSSSSVH